jgi:hypothetical protein
MSERDHKPDELTEQERAWISNSLMHGNKALRIIDTWKARAEAAEKLGSAWLEGRSDATVQEWVALETRVTDLEADVKRHVEMYQAKQHDWHRRQEGWRSSANECLAASESALAQAKAELAEAKAALAHERSHDWDTPLKVAEHELAQAKARIARAIELLSDNAHCREQQALEVLKSDRQG